MTSVIMTFEFNIEIVLLLLLLFLILNYIKYYILNAHISLVNQNIEK